MSEITSRPYRPEQCCEACVFGRGEHAEWCEKSVGHCERCCTKEQLWRRRNWLKVIFREIVANGAD